MKLYVSFGVLLVLGVLGLSGCGPQNQSPLAKFDYTPTTPKVNEEVIFDASSTETPDKGAKITSYKWDFGDGATGSDVSVTHKYAAAGSFAVKLTVTDTKGATGETTQTILVTASGLAKCDLPKDQEFSSLTWDGQSLWSARYAEGDDENGKILKISFSATSCSVQATLKSPGHLPGGLAWDGQNLWVSDVKFNDDGTSVLKLFKLNPTNGDVLSSCQFSGQAEDLEINAMAWDGQSLWLADITSKKIEKINPSGNNCQVVSSFKSPSEGDPNGLAWDGQSLWIADTGDKEPAKLLKVNSSTGKVEASFAAPGEGSPQGLAFDTKTASFWVLDSGLKENTVIQWPLPK
ncbi:PKD domain-containing protein [Candidatus Acetothermia bacterium]|nr:PKD domain-containing protein [Candidatus Acetothermia bacterium]